MLRFLEFSWLLVVLFGSCFGIYKTCTEGFIYAIYIFICSIIALIFYIIRRKQRVDMERQKEENELLP